MREGLIKIIEGLLDEIENFVKMNEEIILTLTCGKNRECYEVMEGFKKKNNIKYFTFLKTLLFVRTFLAAIPDDQEKSNIIIMKAYIYLSIVEEMLKDYLKKTNNLSENERTLLDKLVKKVDNIINNLQKMILP